MSFVMCGRITSRDFHVSKHGVEAPAVRCFHSQRLQTGGAKSSLGGFRRVWTLGIVSSRKKKKCKSKAVLFLRERALFFFFCLQYPIYVFLSFFLLPTKTDTETEVFLKFKYFTHCFFSCFCAHLPFHCFGTLTRKESKENLYERKQGKLFKGAQGRDISGRETQRVLCTLLPVVLDSGDSLSVVPALLPCCISSAMPCCRLHLFFPLPVTSQLIQKKIARHFVRRAHMTVMQTWRFPSRCLTPSAPFMQRQIVLSPFASLLFFFFAAPQQYRVSASSLVTLTHTRRFKTKQNENSS